MKPESGAPIIDWRAHPFLHGLRPHHLAALEQCAMPVEFSDGETIFREGDVANRFYLIVDGHVLVEAAPAGNFNVTLDEVHSGGVLGWSWLFPPYRWHFTARAIKPTLAVFFYGTWLRELGDEKPDLGYEVMKRVAQVVIHRLQATRSRLPALQTQRCAKR